MNRAAQAARLHRVSSSAATAVVVAVVAITVLLVASTARAQSLQGSVVSSVVFPNRTLILSVPHSVAPGASQVHVTENGASVQDLSVTSLKQAGPGDLGVVIMIDTDPSMIGPPLDRALAAARTLAAQRSGAQELGVIFGNGAHFPLTSDASAISQALANPPAGHSPMNLLSMTRAAVGELTAAGIADRAIIYVTDDIDRSPSYSPESIGAYASAAHVRIFTVGVRDGIWTNPLPQDLSSTSMRSVAISGGGTYIEAVPSQLRGAFADIEAGLISQYIVHYRSRAAYNHNVTLSVLVDGVQGVFNTSYRSPAPPPLPVFPRHHTLSPVPKEFWTSSLALALEAIGCALFLAFGIAAIASYYGRSGELRARVRAFVPAPTPALVGERVPIPTDLARPLEQILERGRWWPSFVEKVAISSIDRSPIQLVCFSVGGSLVALILVDLITGSTVVGILALAIGPLVVRALVNRSVRRQRQRFMEQLPSQLHEIASAMRTGRSMVEAVAVVAGGADQPMRRELELAAADERAGVHLEEALLPTAQRMESNEMEQVAIVAALHRRTGANITEVLDRMADAARQRVEIRRELRALTAQARLSRNILTALPVVVVLAIDLIGHQYEKPLFHTTPGVIVLVLGALMVATGYWVMKSIVNIEE